MKIGNVLTPEESMRIHDNVKFKTIDEVTQTELPTYDKETDSYKVNGIEYPTEDEAYEAIDEMEI